MYDYTESGLDNVYLKNGYKIHKTVYGEGVSIENTDGLHKVIAKWLVEMPKPLIGAEVRFFAVGNGPNATGSRGFSRGHRANG